MNRGVLRAVILVAFCAGLALVVSRCNYFAREPYRPATPYIVEKP